METISVQIWLKEGDNHQMAHSPWIESLDWLHRLPCLGEFLELPSHAGS